MFSTFLAGAGASSVGCKGYESEDHSLPPYRVNAWSYTSAL